MQDMCFVGATNGCIYAIDLSVTAIAISAANASVGYVNSKRGGEDREDSVYWSGVLSYFEEDIDQIQSVRSSI